MVVYPGWLEDWTELLTHNRELWHPKAEPVLWRPDLQETKCSEGGGTDVRYRAGQKRTLLDELLDLVAVHTPYLRVRYAF